MVLEPIFVNPGSYQSLEIVLRDLGKRAGIARYSPGPLSKRKWMAIECDGQPYVLCMRLLRENLVCKQCELFVKKSIKGDHIDQFHPWASEDHSLIDFERELDWILLVPGPGHLEMNMLKATVKLTWDIFWESLVELFQFVTPVPRESLKMYLTTTKVGRFCEFLSRPF